MATSEPEPRWIEPEPVSRQAVEELRRELDLPPELCELLVRRGHGEAGRARRFLRPAFDHLHDPMALPDARPALERLAAAAGETVLVHGDYDVDGLSAAALLARGLEELGARVHAFVPHRTRDGYDFGEAGLERAREVDADLVVTADCGVSAAETVARARAEGRDVVITDHHRPPARLPDAEAVVNPRRQDASYPFEGLSGVGVAHRLLCGLWERTGRDPADLNRHLDLVALGTVGDVVPLVDENRVLVRGGLRVLERTRKAGLRALMDVADVGEGVDAEDVAYRLAPRLNAVGRIGEAREGLRLLLTGDPGEARELAARLERRNRERREEDRRVLRDAEGRLEERYDPEADRSVVLWGEGWHPGVLGIVASRISERLHRPAILVGLDGERGRGSGRSVPGFHLHRALERCAPLLERFGGHRGAAGFEIRRENLEALAERVESAAREELGPSDLRPELRLDLTVALARADEPLLRGLRHLAPFGRGNGRPLLLSRGVAVRDASRVGSGGEHLRAELAGPDGGRLGAIGFGLGPRADELAGDGRWDVAYELVEDRWRGRRRLQARLRDLRPADG